MACYPVRLIGEDRGRCGSGGKGDELTVGRPGRTTPYALRQIGQLARFAPEDRNDVKLTNSTARRKEGQLHAVRRPDRVRVQRPPSRQFDSFTCLEIIEPDSGALLIALPVNV